MDDYTVEGSARCPHCGISVQFTKGATQDLTAVGNYWTNYSIRWVECPHCHEIVITLIHQPQGGPPLETSLYPLNSQRPPVPPQVPPVLKADYDEAALILPLSAKGSAALSRRCLEEVLSDAGGARKKNLADKINEVAPKLPAYLYDVLDQVRVIGNFSAHPLKDTTSGAIVDVEPGEAEWNLDVLDQLFDFFYVKPATIQRMKEQLGQKLTAVGKPPI